MKYIHKFDNAGDFNAAYNDTGGTVITSITCSEGTYAYDGYEDNYLGTGQRAYMWASGNDEIITEGRNPNVGDNCFRFFVENGEIVDGEAYEITAIGTETTEGSYIEPWVSRTNVKKIIVNGMEFEYVGEFDVYVGTLA